jgi:FkbM family methyltransferase
VKMQIEEFFKKDQISYSQLRQDIFALYHRQDSPGYFVEFGSLDGIDTSNTYLLEKHHGWTGILAEPLPRFHEDLRRNRTCIIEPRCVFSHSGDVVQFGEVEDFPAVSTLISHKDQHSMWKEKRQTNKIHDVVTVSLDDMLDEHNSPAVIDYLSIDTEGSEYTILSAHSFKRPFNTMSVEYANKEEREKLFNLLTAHKYIRAHANLSQWEDWYVYAPWYVEKYH